MSAQANTPTIDTPAIDLPGAAVPAAPTPWALVALALSMLLSSLGTSVANVALPSLATAFGVSFQSVQWVVIAYLLAITVVSVGVGRLGDAVGRRRVLLGGILLFTAASALCAAAPTLPALIAARAIQGVGAAALMALTVALVGDSVPAERTGRAMGLLGTTSAIGTALGPSLGGLMISGPGWRVVFLVMVPLGLLNLLLVARHVPGAAPGKRTNREPFDGVGALLLALTLGAYALAMTLGHGRFGAVNAALLATAAVAAGGFLIVERRAKAPLIRAEALRDRVLGAGLLTTVIVAAVMMTTLVVGPFYLSRGLGLGEAAVGLVLAAGPALSTVSGVPAGRLVDRLGAPRAVVAGLAAMAMGAAALTLAPERFGVAGYLAAIALLTPGYQLFQAANNTAVMAGAGAERRGVMSGLLSLSRNLGLITGAAAMGALFAAATGGRDVTAATPDAVAFGMETTFAVATAAILVALLLAVRTCSARAASGTR